MNEAKGGCALELYGIIIFRTILLYLVITVIFRMMGKREIGELGIIDLVVFVMIAEMAVMSIENSEESIFKSVIPMIVLLIIQFLSSYLSLKSRRFRKYADGEPSIIIKNGKINEREMKKQRYNFDDLLMQLRQKDIRNLADVEYAFLEPTGKLSVFTREPQKKGYTVPVILDGTILKEKLKDINRTEQWLLRQLEERGYNEIENISFCSYTDGELYVDIKDG